MGTNAKKVTVSVLYWRASMGPLSKKRKFVKDGLFYAELFEFLRRELAEDGFSGVEHRVTPTRTEIVIKATKTKEVLGDKGRRIRELTSLVQQRWHYPEGGVQLFVERVPVRGLSAMAQAESLRFKLLSGLPLRRAAMGIMRFVMESGAKGVDVLESGDAKAHHTDQATRHVCLRAGTIGIKMQIMLPYDAEGIQGTAKMHPDVITVIPPKEVVA